ncbi:F-box protein At3g07870-like [Papaver somniferum]|uniref:F-box protein At3g07870-like n=1 Tax=Papaver somniferum TaxID=3469 RepID=UPI000E6FC860|nr:F-box protein At3g07870-like [Papaver somniferum]
MKKTSGRKRKADDAETNSIIKPIPNEISLNILSRLPFDSVLDSKFVSKSWCKAIQNPSFAQIHFRQQQLDGGYSDTKVSFLFSTIEEKSRLYYGDYDENRENLCMFLKTVNHPHIRKRFGTNAMVGSCNGLVCFSVPFTHHIDDPIYICNPNIGEQITLPRFSVIARNKKNVEFKKTTYLDGIIVSGFGYNPVIDEYKVVRIYCADPRLRSVDQPKGQVQVYTLGSGSGWRNIGECPYSLQRFNSSRSVLDNCESWSDNKSAIYIPSRGILANGALHWLDEAWNVVSFDLADERFSLLPSPPCFRPGEKNFYTLQVLGGYLCVVNAHDGKNLDIWSFKKDNSEWANMFSISCQSNEFMDVYWPISLTLSGKLLLRSNYETLMSYDPQTREFKKLVDLNTDMLFETLTYPLIESIPHINSIVSLKALGEKTKKIARAMDVDDYDPDSD